MKRYIALLPNESIEDALDHYQAKFQDLPETEAKASELMSLWYKLDEFKVRIINEWDYENWFQDKNEVLADE